MIRKLVCCLICVLLCVVSINANGIKERVAVLQLKAIGTDATMVDGIVENFVTELIKLNKFEIVERNQINLVLSELNLSNTDDFNDDSAAEIGGLLGAEFVIIGSVTKLGDKITINIRAIDVKTGLADKAESVTVSNDNELVRSINRLAHLLSNGDSVEVADTADNSKHMSDTKKNLILSPVKLTPLKISGFTFIGIGSAFALTGGALLVYQRLGYLPILQNLSHYASSKSQYQSYKDAYNINLSLFITSVSLMGVGVGLLTAAIPMIIYKKKDKSVSLFIDMDNSLSFGFRICI